MKRKINILVSFFYVLVLLIIELKIDQAIKW